MTVQEFEAGEGQVIVVYEMDDRGEMIDPPAAWRFVALDAAGRAAQGWRIVSTAGLPMRQMGTAGNILFQSGGQFATQAAIAVVYAQR